MRRVWRSKRRLNTRNRHEGVAAICAFIAWILYEARLVVVVAAEREACAQLVEAADMYYTEERLETAAAIRARKP